MTATLDRVDELRARMVETLATNVHPRATTLDAFRRVPRHFFLPGVDVDRVYAGTAIPTRHDEHGRPTSSSSEPAIMALMLDSLELDLGDRVLEIGSGTGYNAAILAALVGADRVVTVDIDGEICREAREHLRQAGFDVEVETTDGWLGWPSGAPYDRIELTASTGDFSPDWLEQLADGGIFVGPIAFRPNAQAIVALRRRGTALESTRVLAGGFMSLRGIGGAVDTTREIGRWRVASSLEIDADRFAALLEGTPSVEVVDSVSWGDLAMFALVEPRSVSLARQGSPAYATGILSEAGDGLAFVEWSGTVLWPRMLLISFGVTSAAALLRQRFQELRGADWGRLRVVATPTGAATPVGATVFVREHFTFAVELGS